MARFTSIGMPKKTFVQSSMEETTRFGDFEDGGGNAEAGPSEGGKRKRDGGFRKDEQRSGWGRDPNIAKRARANEARTDDRRKRRIADRNSSVTCFACRSVGHAARDCPNILLAASGANGSAAMLEAGKVADVEEKGELEAEGGEKAGGKMKRAKGKKGGDVTGGKCYRCNSSLHSLSKCPKPIDASNPTPFATCFICLGTGHLSAGCPSNSRGVYVNGGSCKVCGGVSHRAKDCPQLAHREGQDEGERVGRGRGGRQEVVFGSGVGLGADEDDFMGAQRQSKPNNLKRHQPAKNSMRGPAKVKGDEGAYDKAQPVVMEFAEATSVPSTRPNKFAAGSAKPKAKVVSF